ncbi:hypothetical protein IU459_36640 [Nocardia amamiensis]|uniref:Uncharacterized protein n=1 Tax=Nocardia amamiensis TaxID=404578 RepID=A0ABS0D2C3_9NOCA|nr:hypothetical protein [Nocardia amamiensis]MBF6302995.1 hypothetical protein [Nocardia amamiensis]
MPVSKKRKKSKGSPPRRPDIAPNGDEDLFADDEVIEIRVGRQHAPSVVVPGPGNRAGFSDGESTFLPTAMIHDSRLCPAAVVTYGQLLIARPPFRVTWEELTAFVPEWDRHPDDSEEETLEGLAQLRTHGYLVPCEDGWTLDVPADAEANAYEWSRR